MDVQIIGETSGFGDGRAHWLRMVMEESLFALNAGVDLHGVGPLSEHRLNADVVDRVLQLREVGGGHRISLRALRRDKNTVVIVHPGVNGLTAG